MKILKFPEFRQTYDYDCGAKAVQAVLAYYGHDIREDFIMKTAKTNKEGTVIDGIKKVLKNNELKWKENIHSIDDIKEAIDKGNPVIILLQAWTDKNNINWEKDWEDGHYVVAIGYNKDQIIFEDPSSNQRTFLTFSEFMERWHDVDVDGKKYINYGLVVYGKKGLYNYEKPIHMN